MRKIKFIILIFIISSKVLSQTKIIFKNDSDIYASVLFTDVTLENQKVSIPPFIRNKKLILKPKTVSTFTLTVKKVFNNNLNQFVVYDYSTAKHILFSAAFLKRNTSTGPISIPDDCDIITYIITKSYEVNQKCDNLTKYVGTLKIK